MVPAPLDRRGWANLSVVDEELNYALKAARLPTALASLNSGHNSDLCAYCVDVRSLSRPNMIPTKPLHPRSTAWRSSFVANLNNITLGHMPIIKVEVCIIASRCCVAVMTLACNVIWPCNNSLLNRCTSGAPSQSSSNHRP